MPNNYIQLSQENIANEHICCAFSDKKCADSYALKKQWLHDEFASGYVFRRLDGRAKVFLEYGDAETAWLPVTAPNHLVLGCFWVSGKYKKQGHGKALLQSAIDDAKARSKSGLVTVAGKKKLHFMSEGKWLKRQGFEVVDSLPSGFELLALGLDSSAKTPAFNNCVKPDVGSGITQTGIVVYFSNRCPYSEYHVTESLAQTAQKRGLALTVNKLTSCTEAQSAPTPATIFSLFLDGKFITTDVSACMDSRFDKIIAKAVS